MSCVGSLFWYGRQGSGENICGAAHVNPILKIIQHCGKEQSLGLNLDCGLNTKRSACMLGSQMSQSQVLAAKVKLDVHHVICCTVVLVSPTGNVLNILELCTAYIVRLKASCSLRCKVEMKVHFRSESILTSHRCQCSWTRSHTWPVSTTLNWHSFTSDDFVFSKIAT